MFHGASLARKGAVVVTLNYRLGALGFLAHRLIDERHTQRRSELIALIQISLGGMVAEELFFGRNITTAIKVGQARAQAYASLVKELGKENIALLEFLKEIATGNIKVVPDVSVSGSQGSLLDALIGNYLKQQKNKNNGTKLKQKS